MFHVELLLHNLFEILDFNYLCPVYELHADEMALILIPYINGLLKELARLRQAINYLQNSK